MPNIKADIQRKKSPTLAASESFLWPKTKLAVATLKFQLLHLSIPVVFIRNHYRSPFSLSPFAISLLVHLLIGENVYAMSINKGIMNIARSYKVRAETSFDTLSTAFHALFQNLACYSKHVGCMHSLIIILLFMLPLALPS